MEKGGGDVNKTNFKSSYKVSFMGKKKGSWWICVLGVISATLWVHGDFFFSSVFFFFSSRGFMVRSKGGGERFCEYHQLPNK